MQTRFYYTRVYVHTSYKTVVVRTPDGWLVTHAIFNSDKGGGSVHSINVEDPAHTINPKDFDIGD